MSACADLCPGTPLLTCQKRACDIVSPRGRTKPARVSSDITNTLVDPAGLTLGSSCDDLVIAELHDVAELSSLLPGAINS
jgi:hypothetical protein